MTAPESYVDAHFHIWDLKKFDYPWPTENEAAIFRNFLPDELHENITQTPVRHCVFVQCMNNFPDEAKWVLKEAEKHTLIKGVVAGLDVSDPKLEENLDQLKNYPLFKGCRQILDFEDETWITRSDVHRGFIVLQDRGLTFDLLLRPHLLKYIPEVVAKFPRLKFVVDHIAKPYIKDKKIDVWKKEIAEIAKFENVFCKISGLVTEADWSNWKTEDFQPYVDHIISCFGIDRCMFGSDWPVCNLANAKYADVFNLIGQLLPTLTEEEKTKLFRNNAAKFYNLDLS